MEGITLTVLGALVEIILNMGIMIKTELQLRHTMILSSVQTVMVVHLEAIIDKEVTTVAMVEVLVTSTNFSCISNIEEHLKITKTCA